MKWTYLRNGWSFSAHQHHQHHHDQHQHLPKRSKLKHVLFLLLMYFLLVFHIKINLMGAVEVDDCCKSAMPGIPALLEIIFVFKKLLLFYVNYKKI